MQKFDVHLSSGDHGESIPRFSLVARLNNLPTAFEEGCVTDEAGIYARWGTLPEEWRVFLRAMINRPEILEISGKVVLGRVHLELKLAPVDFEDFPGLMAKLANTAFYTTTRELNISLFAITMGRDSLVLPSANGLFRWDGLERLQLRENSSLAPLTACGQSFLGRVLRETRADTVQFCRALQPVVLTVPDEKKLYRAIFGGEPASREPAKTEDLGYESHLFSHRSPTIIYPSPVTHDDLKCLDQLLAETVGLRLKSS